MGAILCEARASHFGGFSDLGTWVSVVVAHGLSCSSACGICLNQGSNLCPLHWQVEAYPLYHQGSTDVFFAVSLQPRQPQKGATTVVPQALLGQFVESH